jgi:hypothetical protein
MEQMTLFEWEADAAREVPMDEPERTASVEQLSLF